MHDISMCAPHVGARAHLSVKYRSPTSEFSHSTAVSPPCSRACSQNTAAEKSTAAALRHGHHTSLAAAHPRHAFGGGMRCQ
jgi:hypothetical protein